MKYDILNFQSFIHTVFSSYFSQEKEEKTEILFPESQWLQSLLPESTQFTFKEQIVLLLALMPHISPQTLDLFFLQNKDLDRPYTEFGGWKGSSHSGFLPTGETAAFLLSVAQPGDREKVMHLFSKEHWFYKNNIFHLEGQGEGEPFLSGRLVVSDEVLAKLQNRAYEPEYNASFPANVSPPRWIGAIWYYPTT